MAKKKKHGFRKFVNAKKLRKIAAYGLTGGLTAAGAIFGGGAGATAGAQIGGRLGARIGFKSKDARARFRAGTNYFSALAGVGTTALGISGALGKDRKDPLRALFGKTVDLFSSPKPGHEETEAEMPLRGPTGETNESSGAGSGPDTPLPEKNADMARVLLIGGAALVVVGGFVYFVATRKAG